MSVGIAQGLNWRNIPISLIDSDIDSRARPLPSPDPVPNYGLLIKTGLVYGRLDRVVKSAPVVFIDCYEPEWLLVAGDRNQHFCCAEYQASLCPKHQSNSRMLIQEAGQAKQPASNGNDLQFAAQLDPALEAKHSRGTTYQVHSWRSRMSF